MEIFRKTEMIRNDSDADFPFALVKREMGRDVLT